MGYCAHSVALISGFYEHSCRCKQNGGVTIPFIEVHHLEGRTEEQRQRLAQAITEAVVEIFKVQKESVWIKFSEAPKSYVATGGILKSKQ